ncbi:hypothetical protein ABZ883_18685 [Streptomyces sp. NPDC046977]|uniref:hypothetical protein n=1 Tax=Streptomyces sp. NPDC046977 TaxID=3154703 RepID=UPI0033F49DD8
MEAAKSGESVAILSISEAQEPTEPPVRGVHVLFVQGASATAVVRHRTGESVVLLSGELPSVLTPSSLNELLNLAAAVLTPEEMELFRSCLTALRCGEKLQERRIEVSGAVLTVHSS